MGLISIQMGVIKISWEPGMVPLMTTFWTSWVLGWVRQGPLWLHVAEAHPLPHDSFMWGRQLSSTHTLVDLGAIILNMQPPQVPRKGGRVENHAGNFLPWPSPGHVAPTELQAQLGNAVSACSGEMGEQWFAVCGPKSTESESTGILLEKKIHRLYHRPRNQELSILGFNQFFRLFWCTSQSENHWGTALFSQSLLVCFD